jgi:hypothetical protein
MTTETAPRRTPTPTPDPAPPDWAQLDLKVTASPGSFVLHVEALMAGGPHAAEAVAGLNALQESELAEPLRAAAAAVLTSNATARTYTGQLKSRDSLTRQLAEAKRAKAEADREAQTALAAGSDPFAHQQAALTATEEARRLETILGEMEGPIRHNARLTEAAQREAISNALGRIVTQARAELAEAVRRGLEAMLGDQGPARLAFLADAANTYRGMGGAGGSGAGWAAQFVSVHPEDD